MFEKIVCDFDNADVVIQLQLDGESGYTEYCIKKRHIGYFFEQLREGDFARVEVIR